MKPESGNHYYDGWFYANFIDRGLIPIRKRIARWVPAHSRVLDIGCGTGALLFHLADRVVSGTGIELSSRMIRTARQKASGEGLDHLEFIQQDARALEGVPNGCFDIATTTLVIHEMPAEVRLPVLGEMRRVAEKLILVDYAIPQPQGIGRWGTQLMEFLAGWKHFRSFLEFKRLGGMPALIESAGFLVEAEQITGNGSIKLWLCV